MKIPASTFSMVLALSSFVMAGDPPANGELICEDSFERAELGKGWGVNAGEWNIVDGVLRVRENPSDKYSAAARRILETKNAVYELKFRFTGDGKSFHFGFDPARGELDKKGHLFSTIVTPTPWKITKHVDKAKPKEDLATAKMDFEKDRWYTLRVTTRGKQVTATIDGENELKGSHSTFGVKKSTLVFRCLGDGVEVDDIRVWAMKGT